jgi:hypothetical protein
MTEKTETTIDAGETSRQEEEAAEVEAPSHIDEFEAYRDALFELLVHVKDAPLNAESAREILERHGLDGLLILVSDDQPEIEQESAAIDNVFDDLIDQEALSRELST